MRPNNRPVGNTAAESHGPWTAVTKSQLDFSDNLDKFWGPRKTYFRQNIIYKTMPDEKNQAIENPLYLKSNIDWKISRHI